MALLLDTHVWAQLAEGSARLDQRTRNEIDEAGHRHELFVSIASVWELAMLDGRGRIRLSLPCHEWVHAALAPRSIALANLTVDIVIASTRLPGTIHGDPMDRMIVATAREISATLVTADRALLRYGRAGHLDVLEA